MRLGGRLLSGVKRTSRSTQKVPYRFGHCSGIAERSPADLALFVEPPELFLPLFASDKVAVDANRPFPRG